MINFFKRKKDIEITGDLVPRGIKSTVSYSKSLNDTFRHIREQMKNEVITRREPEGIFRGFVRRNIFKVKR